MSRGRILLVDDDADLRASTAQALDLAGFEVSATDAPEDVPALIGYAFPGIVVTDIRMPRLDGISLMERIHALDREVPVILITGHGDVQLAVRAMRAGAHDFIEKPFSGSQLAETCARALDYRRLVLENRVLRAAAGQKEDLEQRLVGRSNAMIDLRRRMRTIGPAETDVLITGATGTGKEVVARALHDLSARAARPFIAIDCAALPEAQIESELFGHEPGAFPGAMRARYGRFEHARGGTVLLDDIGSMPLAVQGRLLRVVQERVITPLGSNEGRMVDIRIIATSRSPLQHEVAEGRFRADLFYRLAVVSLDVPPLHARREDIPLLFARLLAEAAAGGAAPGRALDLGTGTGYVGLYLAQRGWQVDAVDISTRAVHLAQQNAARNGLDLRIYASNLFDQVQGAFDVIACNPPMRPSETEFSRLVTSTLRRSPRLSQLLMNLVGSRLENNRSEFLAHIVAEARRHLKPNGRLLLGINAGETANLATLPGVHLLRSLPIPDMGAQRVAEFRFETTP